MQNNLYNSRNQDEPAEPIVLTVWAQRNLPGRLDALQTSKLLGFGVDDITILMAVGLITPLGNPAPNAPKWFAAVILIRLATDPDWLHKATRELGKYWRNKRLRRGAHRTPASFVAKPPTQKSASMTPLPSGAGNTQEAQHAR
jgi:hypothetical protein